jgi:hypothetical protein
MIEVKDKKEVAQIKYLNELTKSKDKNLIREVVKHALVMQEEGQKIIFTSDGRQARFMFINYDLPDGQYKIIEDKNSCVIAPIQFDQDYPNVGFLVNWDKDTSYQKIGDYKQVDRDFVASEVVVDSLKVFPECKFIINADYIYSIFKRNEKDFRLIHGDSFLPAYFNGRISPIIFKGDKVISIVMVGNYVKS